MVPIISGARVLVMSGLLHVIMWGVAAVVVRWVAWMVVDVWSLWGSSPGCGPGGVGAGAFPCSECVSVMYRGSMLSVPECDSVSPSSIGWEWRPCVCSAAFLSVALVSGPDLVSVLELLRWTSPLL